MFTRPHTCRHSHVHDFCFKGNDMRLRTPPEDALDWTLPPSPPSPSQAFAAVVLQSKVWMDANACAGICVTRSIMSALILPSGESRRSPPDIFRSADESAGYILQSERPYERWGRAAGRSSDFHCTKDPYCPNCSLLQENLLNGSCRCFLFFPPPLARISSQQRPLYLLLMSFFFLLKCSLFFLSLVWTLFFFFPCPWVCWETGGSCLHWWLDWKR